MQEREQQPDIQYEAPSVVEPEIPAAVGQMTMREVIYADTLRRDTQGSMPGSVRERTRGLVAEEQAANSRPKPPQAPPASTFPGVLGRTPRRHS